MSGVVIVKYDVLLNFRLSFIDFLPLSDELKD